MIDIHSHLLPGVDDGASTWEETLEMARMAVADGVTVMAATPHMMGAFATDARYVKALVVEAQQRLNDASIPLKVVAGGEWFLAYETGAGMDAGTLLTYNDQNKYALVEWSTADRVEAVERILFDVQVRGVTPVVAHAERFADLVKDDNRLAEWHGRGVVFQVNAGSVAPRGEWGGSPFVRAAEKLIQQQWADVVASDAHGVNRRQPGLSRAYERIAAMLDKDEADRLCRYNPGRIVAGESVLRGEPGSRRSTRRGFLARWFQRS